MVSQHNSKTELPNNEPKLILLGSETSEDINHLDEKIVSEADSIEIRADVAWIKTSNGRAFLEILKDNMPESIQVAFTSQKATDDEIIKASINSKPLSDYVSQIEIEEAIKQQLEYEIRYQSIVKLSDRSIIGYEALLRARQNKEVVTADELIKRATKENWLADLDELGRKLAIQGLGPWLGAGLLFVNIMAVDGTFDLTAARKTIQHAIDTGLEPDQLVFETAERNRYINIDLAAAQLNKLRDKGVRLAIDDLGEGYSTLVVATSFKPDVLKLSGEIVNSLPSKEAIATVEAVVNMAHSSGAWVVAEKIETEAQADVLYSLNVDWGQGHLFSKPETKKPGPL